MSTGPTSPSRRTGVYQEALLYLSPPTFIVPAAMERERERERNGGHGERERERAGGGGGGGGKKQLISSWIAQAIAVAAKLVSRISSHRRPSVSDDLAQRLWRRRCRVFASTGDIEDFTEGVEPKAVWAHADGRDAHRDTPFSVRSRGNSHLLVMCHSTIWGQLSYIPDRAAPISYRQYLLRLGLAQRRCKCL